MRGEEVCKAEDRFLFTDELYADSSMALCKEECIARTKSLPLDKTKAYEHFVSWSRKGNEIALFTHYAYADFDIPKAFTCIFELNNPRNVIHTDFQLTQCLYEGWYPVDSIEHGHKHLCIFTFADKIPEIFQKISVRTGNHSDVSKDPLYLGICNSEDFEAISTRQIHVNKLRAVYGSEWWKFDE